MSTATNPVGFTLDNVAPVGASGMLIKGVGDINVTVAANVEYGQAGSTYDETASFECLGIMSWEVVAFDGTTRKYLITGQTDLAFADPIVLGTDTSGVLPLGQGGTGLTAADNAALLTGIGGLPTAGGTMTGAIAMGGQKSHQCRTDRRGDLRFPRGLDLQCVVHPPGDRQRFDPDFRVRGHDHRDRAHREHARTEREPGIRCALDRHGWCRDHRRPGRNPCHGPRRVFRHRSRQEQRWHPRRRRCPGGAHLVNFMAILAGALTSAEGVAILGTPTALWDASTTNTLHIYSYTLDPAATGLVVIAYADSGQTFTLCEWDPIGTPAVAMTALTARSNGNTRCQMFYLLGPIPGTGAGTVRLSASLADAMGIVPISIKGWNGTAPIETGQAAGSGSPPGLTLASVVPGSLVIHGLCAGTFDATMSFTGVGEVALVNVSQSNLRMGASQLVSAAGGSVVVGSTLSTGRYADVAAAFPPASAPNIYYVDASATGNDSANGLSPSTPWKTIAKVNSSTFQPGDTILFAGGQTFTGGLAFTATSWNRTAAATNPITIGSYGTGRATISSGTTYGFISENLGGFHLRDLIFTGASGAVHGVMIWNSETGNGKIQYVRVTNLLIQSYDGHGFLLYGGFATGTAGFNDVIVDGVVATGNTGRGSNVGTAGIAALGRYGFNLDTANPTHTNVTFRNCVSHGNTGRTGAANWTGSGIIAAGVRTCLIEYCVAYNNGVNSNSPAGPCGIMAFDSDLVTIQYCEAYDNKTGNNVDGGGFDLDGGMSNSVIQYCYAHSNAGAGLMLYAYTDANVSSTSWTTNTIRYCISQNDAVGRTGWASGGLLIAKFDATMTNARVYNNTVYSNSTGAAVCYVGLGGTTGTMSGTVANNIFYSSNNARLVDAESYNPTGVTFQKNDYYGPGGVRFRWNGVSTTSRTAWGRDATGLDVNPQLFSAGSGGTLNGYVIGQPAAYQLQIGSPMIGAGLNMSTTFSIDPGTKDFYGTTIPVGGTFEIGAYEGPGV